MTCPQVNKAHSSGSSSPLQRVLVVTVDETVELKVVETVLVGVVVGVVAQPDKSGRRLAKRVLNSTFISEAISMHAV